MQKEKHMRNKLQRFIVKPNLSLQELVVGKTKEKQKHEVFLQMLGASLEENDQRRKSWLKRQRDK